MRRNDTSCPLIEDLILQRVCRMRQPKLVWMLTNERSRYQTNVGIQVSGRWKTTIGENAVEKSNTKPCRLAVWLHTVPYIAYRVSLAYLVPSSMSSTIFSDFHFSQANLKFESALAIPTRPIDFLDFPTISSRPAQHLSS